MAAHKQVTTIILAAGRSTRTGPRNKLLLPCGPTTVIGYVARKAISVGDTTVVVTGHDSEHVRAAISDLPVSVVANDEYASGMASSIVCGVRHRIDSDFFLIWPGDMPLISKETVRVLTKTGRDRRIVVPSFEQRRGHPVLFSGSFRGQLTALRGDSGARSILTDYPDKVDEIRVADAGILFDVDTMNEHAELLDRL